MSLPLILACFWVLAATATALLPMRYQLVPGLALLIAAPVLVVWIGMEHGIWWALGGLAAFASMFRRPLFYLGKRMLGHPAERPSEMGRQG